MKGVFVLYMNKQQRHYYKKKYNKIKKYINRDFTNYDKEYSLNEVNGCYEVKFILQKRVINFTILPDCLYQEFKQTIERNISNLTSEVEECKICFNEIKFSTYCRQCSLLMCFDCFNKIKESSDFFSCPQCKYTPKQIKKTDTTEYQLPSGREQYRSILQFCLQSQLENQLLSQLLNK